MMTHTNVFPSCNVSTHSLSLTRPSLLPSSTPPKHRQLLHQRQQSLFLPVISLSAPVLFRLFLALPAIRRSASLQADSSSSSPSDLPPHIYCVYTRIIYHLSPSLSRVSQLPALFFSLSIKREKSLHSIDSSLCHHLQLVLLGR